MRVSELSIDVLIPHYGRRTDLLRQAVTSVLAQTSSAWTLTVVEDGQQDPEIATWLAQLRDTRISHHVNRSTLGIAGNFQRCLDVSSAAWVVFLGCDDILRPGYVEAVLDAAFRSTAAAAIHPAVDVMDDLGESVRPLADRIKAMLTPDAGSLRGDRCLARLLTGNWAYFPAIAWRREVIARIGFRQDLPTTLDLALLAAALLEGHELLKVDSPGISYRRHVQSASSLAAREASRFEEEARLFAELEHVAARRGWSRSARAARWHITSRAHALLLGVTTQKTQEVGARGRLIRHALRRP